MQVPPENPTAHDCRRLRPVGGKGACRPLIFRSQGLVTVNGGAFILRSFKRLILKRSH